MEGANNISKRDRTFVTFTGFDLDCADRDPCRHARAIRKSMPSRRKWNQTQRTGACFRHQQEAGETRINEGIKGAGTRHAGNGNAPSGMSGAIQEASLKALGEKKAAMVSGVRSDSDQMEDAVGRRGQSGRGVFP